MNLPFKFFSKKGAGLVEYGILGGLVSVVAIGAVLQTGEEVETAFCSAANGVADGMSHERPLADCDQVAEGGGGDPEGPGGPGGPEAPPAYDPISPNILMTYSGSSARVLARNLGSGVMVDWGDGSPPEPLMSDSHHHVFTSPGTYQVAIQGDVGHLGSTNCGYVPENLVSVDSFGADGPLTSLECAFNQTDGLTSLAPIPPSVRSIGRMMYESTSNPTGMNDWDISGVTGLYRVFYRATAFNQPLDNWDTSNVTHATLTFYQARAFNQPLDSWDWSSATQLSGLFGGALSFNQDLNSWDTSNVEQLNAMFNGASAFNGNISNWDLSSATTIEYMFRNAGNFNQDLSGWCASGVSATGYADGASSWEASNRPNFSC